jgi:cytochrome c-type biogenesis protein CcmH/NrfF
MHTYPALRTLRRALTFLAAVLAALAVTTLTFPAAKPAAKAAQWPPPVSAEEMDLQRQIRDIAVDLRAPCCPELTVAQHDSPVTIEMKKLMHDMLQQGKSRRQIVSALQEKYGDVIFPKSKIAGTDLLLYVGVPGLVLAIVWAVWWHLRSRRKPEVLHLADDRWGKDSKKAA